MSSNQMVEFMFDYKKQIRTLRVFLMGSIFLLILSFFTIMAMIHRKPFVIRVASNGETSVIEDQNPYASADGEEAKYFTQQFLNLYLAPNSDSVNKDIALALSWMVPDLQSKHTNAYVDNDYIRQIKTQQVRSELYLNSLATSQESEGYFVITKGIVETYKKEAQTTIKRSFEARLNLVQTQRTPYNPQGLLVSNIDVVYREDPLYKDRSHDQEVVDGESGD